MNNTKTAFAALVAGLVAFAPSAKAESDTLGTMPYLHPRACSSIINTDGFEVYWSRNCEVVYIAPNSVSQARHHIKLLGGAVLCESFNSTAESLNTLERLTSAITKKSEDEFAKGNDKKSMEYMEMASKYQKQHDETFAIFADTSMTPASVVQSEFQNDVTSEDVSRFLAQNSRIFINMAKNNQVIPDVQILPVLNSVYSFNLVLPAEGVTRRVPAILETNLPGLDLLVQPDSKTSTAHVKASGAVSGSTTLSLNGTCAWLKPPQAPEDAKPVNPNTPIIETEVGPNYVTVNRSYDVQMKAGYSMNASLNTDITNKVVETLVTNSTNHNLTKTQIYNKTLELNGVEAFVSEVDTDLPLTSEQKGMIEDDIRKGLMDRYFDFYEKKGTLTDLKPVSVVAPEGGNIDVTYWATHCWSSSGWFHSSSGCYDYSYQVPEWNDGHGYNENSNQDIINTVFSQSSTIYDVVTLSRSTLFANPKSEGVKNEIK